VSAAPHVVRHGIDCLIFEAGPNEDVGGIRSKVNNTSGLQIHLIMYRFHPSVPWKKGYPDCQQIMSQITSLWKKYGLDSKIEFDTRVKRIYKDAHVRWTVNDPSHRRFDGVITAIGTCGLVSSSYTSWIHSHDHRRGR
jgi:cation diffusion facilitator CzcD-associated flavoprotein CzcO